MTNCSVSQDELDHDIGAGRWAEAKHSIFDHMPEYLGEDKPAEKVTGGSFAVVENNNAS